LARSLLKHPHQLPYHHDRRIPEVAEKLFISPRTVGQHLRSIYNRLNVANRTEAIRVAVEREII
jgi:DNA-binding NarL/FixJ family response regulator